MDFSTIPEWVGNASAAALIVITVLVFYSLITKGLIPFLRELNDDRRRLQAEQREFYENKVIPTLQGLADNLKNALEIQRVQYEGKLAMLENERNLERDKLVRQITELTNQIKTLSARIEILEKDNRQKDAELNDLRKRLNEVEAERDSLKARLLILDMADAARHGESSDSKPRPTDTPANA